MKTLVFALLSVPLIVFAQKVDLKDLDTDAEETNIKISKGKSSGKEKCEQVWEITEGTADVSGEPNVMQKEAKSNWKKACDDWKKEFRADNKENKIITISCGSAECSSDAAGKSCVSKASYKIKTKLN